MIECTCNVNKEDYVMDEKQQLMELYKEFIYTKENFVNRSFATNKFYIITIAVCLILAAIAKDNINTFGSLTFIAITLSGFAFSLLLFANQDAYAYLLKVKFSAVIDKIEENFCFKPCVEEKNAIVEDKKRKRNFIFSNIQKTYALIAMVIFLFAFLYELVIYGVTIWGF